jgi:prepilin-type N-terminal cleavage/methylation domain-containing protein
MNLRLTSVNRGRAGRRWSSGAFTLPEVIVAVAIVTLAMAGLLAMHLFGLRLNAITTVKLKASDDARAVLSHITQEIRSGGLIRVGTGDANSFAEPATGSPQQGNALEIHPDTGATNGVVRYFLDQTDHRFKRYALGQGEPQVIANSITNQVIFAVEDYAGNVLTNHMSSRVICLNLQFSQLTDPTTPIGPGSCYDFYQLRTKVTRRLVQ